MDLNEFENCSDSDSSSRSNASRTERVLEMMKSFGKAMSRKKNAHAKNQPSGDLPAVSTSNKLLKISPEECNASSIKLGVAQLRQNFAVLPPSSKPSPRKKFVQTVLSFGLHKDLASKAPVADEVISAGESYAAGDSDHNATSPVGSSSDNAVDMTLDDDSIVGDSTGDDNVEICDSFLTDFEKSDVVDLTFLDDSTVECTVKRTVESTRGKLKSEDIEYSPKSSAVTSEDKAYSPKASGVESRKRKRNSRKKEKGQWRKKSIKTGKVFSPVSSDTIPKDSSVVRRGWRTEYVPKYATDEEMAIFENVYSNQILSVESDLPAKFVNTWLRAGKLKKIPPDLFYLNGCDKSAERTQDAPDYDTDDEYGIDPGRSKGETKPAILKPTKAKPKKENADDEDEEKSKKFLLGTNTDFVENPEVIPEKNGDIYYEVDVNGHVLVAVKRYKDGNVHYFHPRVYYMHEDGFIVCCRVGWSQGVGEHGMRNKADIAAGMMELLGKREGSRLFTRSYTILSAQPDLEGYLRATLYSAACNKTSKKFFVHHMSLITFEGKRPQGYVGDHIGARSNNSIYFLRWIPRSENSQKENIDQDQNAPHKNYELSNLDIDEDHYKLLKCDYYKDPECDFIFASGDGTHVINTRTGKHIDIQKKEYKNGFVKYRISIPYAAGKKTVDFSRFLAGCFIGRPLTEKETCDHKDHNRSNNKIGNLLPRHKLFQANNRKINHEGKREDGSIVGVYRKRSHDKKKWAFWVASVRVYTPYGSTASTEDQTHFSIEKLGYEEALAEAIKHRQKYHLFKGMYFGFEGVAPALRKIVAKKE